MNTAMSFYENMENDVRKFKASASRSNNFKLL